MADLPFLRWQLETFPLRAVVCNGKTPLRYVCGLLDQISILEGKIGKKVKTRLVHRRIG